MFCCVLIIATDRKKINKAKVFIVVFFEYLLISKQKTNKQEKEIVNNE